MMNQLFALPDWVPWWVPLAILVPVVLFGLAFLAMPFSVLGLKGRMEGIESRLDEIQGEIRSLSLRLPEPSRGAAGRAGSHSADGEPPLVPRPPTVQRRPPDMIDTEIPPVPQRSPIVLPGIVPIPPISRDLSTSQRPFVRPTRRVDPKDEPPGNAGRAEPRIDWPQ